MRFAYYERLTKPERATYRKSDRITAVAIPDAPGLAPLVSELDLALARGARLATAKAARAFAGAICTQLGAPPVHVVVRLARPEIRGGELHGLYTFGTKQSPPRIEVWMRTAAHRRVVRFRTFLRTLVHELMHHLDVTVFGFNDSFHTAGYYARESSVMRQLLASPKARAGRRTPNGVRTPDAQLGLFDAV